jgi:hypothetical protein
MLFLPVVKQMVATNTFAKDVNKQSKKQFQQLVTLGLMPLIKAKPSLQHVPKPAQRSKNVATAIKQEKSMSML